MLKPPKIGVITAEMMNTTTSTQTKKDYLPDFFTYQSAKIRPRSEPMQAQKPIQQP
jgi:hypothetical protein